MHPAEAPTAGEPRSLLVVTGLYPTPDRPTVGGFVRDRVERLRATGRNVAVVAPRSYRGSVFRRYLRLAARALVAARLAEGVEAHVFVPTGAIGVLAGWVWRKPVVVVAHGSDVLYTAWRHPVLTAVARQVARSASAIVANSNATADAVRRLGGNPVVIAPGVDSLLFSPGPSERTRLGLPSGPVALFVGPDDPHKGLDVFVDAIRRVGWSGVTVGGTGRGPDGSGVHNRPAMDQPTLVRYLRSVDCVVVPSRREGLGLIAIEAASCGTPVVATRVGGLVEIVRDGVNGILVDGADPAQLADALARLPTLGLQPETVRDSVRAFWAPAATRRMDDLWARVARSPGRAQ